MSKECIILCVHLSSECFIPDKNYVSFIIRSVSYNILGKLLKSYL